jgi:hypothetical protein
MPTIFMVPTEMHQCRVLPHARRAINQQVSIEMRRILKEMRAPCVLRTLHNIDSDPKSRRGP